MLELVLQFGPNDVTNKFLDARRLDDEKREMFQRVELHALSDPLNAAIRLLDRSSGLNEDDEYFLENNVQRAYVQNLQQLAETASAAALDLFGKLANERYYSDWVKTRSNEFYEALRDYSSYLPLTAALGNIGKLSDSHGEQAGRLDAISAILIYHTNRLFSFDHRRILYYIDDKSFFMDFEDILGLEEIILCPAFERLIAREDYVAKAIAPLVWNVRQHAFNPDNDVEGRLNQPNFERQIYISGQPENEAEESGYFAVRVVDNGFGIRNEILEKLFEKGTTSKGDDSVEHGIGLWGVKEFVESNGGSIKASSELGKGTTFEFTIPYSHIENLSYVQATPQDTHIK